MIPWGPIISGASSLLGGFLGDRSDSSRDQRSYEFQDKWNQAQYGLDKAGLQLAQDSFDWQKNYIVNRTADARAAGIHPLYALGAPGAGASFSSGGYAGAPSTTRGSSLGGGIAAAGGAAADAVRSMRKDPLAALRAEQLKAEIAATDARATRDLTEAQYIGSKTALQEQRVNTTGAARTFALGSKAGPSLLERGMDIQPNINAPMDITGVMDDGTRMRMWNPDVMGEGADYMNAVKRFGKAAVDAWLKLTRRHPITRSERRAAAKREMSKAPWYRRGQ